MRIYEIYDEELHISVGVLLCYEMSKAFVIELNRNLTEWEAPLLFAGFVRRGIFTIPREESRLWVRERIIPPGRQNIGHILTTHHLEVYDEIRFLEISHGRCAQDRMHLKKTDVLPEYVLLQQAKNLADVTPLDGHRLLCMFAGGEVKIASLEDLADEGNASLMNNTAAETISKIVENQALFESVTVSPGGYAASFDDAIDIPATVLYVAGVDVPLGCSDFRAFVRKNVLSTAESCALMGCSRQNIAYLSKTNQLDPLKREEGGSLYLKGDLQKHMW